MNRRRFLLYVLNYFRLFDILFEFSKQMTSKRENKRNKNAKVAAFVVAFVAPGAILTAAGFTSTGVAGGSIAAAIQGIRYTDCIIQFKKV